MDYTANDDSASHDIGHEITATIKAISQYSQYAEGTVNGYLFVEVAVWRRKKLPGSSNQFLFSFGDALREDPFIGFEQRRSVEFTPVGSDSSPPSSLIYIFRLHGEVIM